MVPTPVKSSNVFTFPVFNFTQAEKITFHLKVTIIRGIKLLFREISVIFILFKDATLFSRIISEWS